VKNDNFDQVKFDQVIVCQKIAQSISLQNTKSMSSLEVKAIISASQQQHLIIVKTG
jgi:hypothetical protein